MNNPYCPSPEMAEAVRTHKPTSSIRYVRRVNCTECTYGTYAACDTCDGSHYVHVAFSVDGAK